MKKLVEHIPNKKLKNLIAGFEIIFIVCATMIDSMIIARGYFTVPIVTSTLCFFYLGRNYGLVSRFNSLNELATKVIKSLAENNKELIKYKKLFTELKERIDKLE